MMSCSGPEGRFSIWAAEGQRALLRGLSRGDRVASIIMVFSSFGWEQCGMSLSKISLMKVKDNLLSA